MNRRDVDDATNAVSGDVLDAALYVHRRLGPGQLESVYASGLARTLEKRGRLVRREVPIRVMLDDMDLGIGFRADLDVDERVLVEIKAVERVLPVHRAQLRTYLRHAQREVGLLFNFNSALLRSGYHREVNSQARGSNLK